MSYLSHSNPAFWDGSEYTPHPYVPKPQFCFLRLPHCPDRQLHQPGLPTDAGYDIHISDDIEVPPNLDGDPYRARTGLILIPPEDSWVGIYARSSLSKKGLILANSVGVVDSGFTGELQLLLYNVRNEPVRIAAGSALAQAVLHKIYDVALNELKADPRTVKRGGIGSTGGYG